MIKKYIAIIPMLLTLLLVGCQEKDYAKYLSRNKTVTIQGPATLAGNEPFTRIVVSPKPEYPVYLGFKDTQALEREIREHHLGKILKVKGQANGIPLQTADGKNTFMRYVLLVKSYEVVQEKKSTSQ